MNEVNTLLFWIIMGLLWWLWQEYRRYNIDRTRARLFSIRDELFIRAAHGEIPMDGDAHKVVREIINGSIRFCHLLTLTHLALLWRASNRGLLSDSEASNAINSALNGLDKQQKQIVASALREFNYVLINHLARGNLILFLITETLSILDRFGVLSVVGHLRDMVYSKSRKLRRLIESEALEAEAHQVA